MVAPSVRSFRSTTNKLQRRGHRQGEGSIHTVGGGTRGDTSPTLTATTLASFLDLGEQGPAIIINRADLRASVAAYENLLAAAKAYRNAMIALSSASTGFAHALEECARVKGAGTSGEQLLAASGMQYLVASSGQILSDTLYRSFEIPLLHAYDIYVATVSARHSEYEALLAEKTAAIRETEMENMAQGRKKNRDLAQFRRALERLQEQVMQVEVCKRSYYSEVLEHETETWNSISGKIALVLRSTVDLSDRLATKGTSDPCLESMMNEHPDPFNVYKAHDEPPRDIFTVLPPLGMNLGLGGSKRSSIIDEEGTVNEPEQARPASSRAGTSSSKDDANTPRTASRKGGAVMSVAEALGLDDTPTKAGSTQHGNDGLKSQDGQRAQTPRRTHRRVDSSSRESSNEPSPVSLRPTTNRSDRNDSEVEYDDDGESSALDRSPTASHETSQNESSDQPRHHRTDSQESSSTTGGSTSNCKAIGRSFISPRKSMQSSQARKKANLSCVTEADAPPDPMAGDWGAPVYGKPLSPVMNGTGGGYDSGEEETVWGGQRSGS